MIKQVDKLVIRAFMGQFIATFPVALAVFMLQFFYVWIDDIIGKGLEWYVVLELLTYLTTNLVPMAAAVGALLAALMSMGSLAERFEILSFNATGTGLLRIQRGLVLFALVLSTSLLAFSEMITPGANLKFYTTLYDIQQSKPALNIPEGQWYREIQGYVIKIDKKSEDNAEIFGVFIRDLNNFRDQDFIMAKSGRMLTANQGRSLVLQLMDGERHQLVQNRKGKGEEWSYVTTHFEKMEKVLDLSDFQLSRTNTDIYSDHYKMMNSFQQLDFVDSLHRNNAHIIHQLRKSVVTSFSFLRDTLPLNAPQVDSNDFPKDLSSVTASLDPLKRTIYYGRAVQLARGVSNLYDSRKPRLDWNKRTIIGAQLEVHKKWTMALGTFVLVMIGIPFGALIRKGGFGLPTIMAILVFVIYFVMSRMAEGLAKKELATPFIAVWTPTALFIVIGILMTIRANRGGEWKMQWIQRLWKKRK